MNQRDSSLFSGLADGRMAAMTSSVFLDNQAFVLKCTNPCSRFLSCCCGRCRNAVNESSVLVGKPSPPLLALEDDSLVFGGESVIIPQILLGDPCIKYGRFEADTSEFQHFLYLFSSLTGVTHQRYVVTSCRADDTVGCVKGPTGANS